MYVLQFPPLIGFFSLGKYTNVKLYKIITEIRAKKIYGFGIFVYYFINQAK